MKSFARFGLIAVALAGVALAVPFVQSVQQTQWFQGGAYFKSLANKAQLTSSNRITDSSSPPLFNWDFPACTGAGWTGVTACHNHTIGISAPGAKIGDVCHVTSDHSIADGGLPDSAFFDCEPIAADLVVVREHYIVTDAGVWDAPDSGYAIRTFSNQ